MLACPNRPLTADTGTWSAMSKVALEWRKLWKWVEVRSFAFKNLLNQLVILWGSNGAPSALVKIKSFLMVLPHISTVRTHADPMRKRCSRCIWRYSRSSSIQLSPTRIIRRERLVLGGAKTTPAPGILCIIEGKAIRKMKGLSSIQRWHDDVITTRAWHGTGWNAWNRYGSVEERTAEYWDEQLKKSEERMRELVELYEISAII